jgi:hypothetical protein
MCHALWQVGDHAALLPAGIPAKRAHPADAQDAEEILTSVAETLAAASIGPSKTTLQPTPSPEYDTSVSPMRIRWSPHPGTTTASSRSA